MKRLIENENRDQYLGQIIEIINPKSKYSGFRGWVDKRFFNDKYKISLPPAKYEETDKLHILYVDKDDIYRWVRIINI